MIKYPELKLYNSLTRMKEVFTPIEGDNIRLYACGPTVYDFAHIGNARPVIVFDVLYRLLRHIYGAAHVTYVRNITDVDDKINKRAAERGISIRELTEGTFQQFQADVDALHCLRPDHQPRATEFICDDAQPMDMVRLIKLLISRGHAYEAEGHVLFHVPSMANYGALARRSLDEMQAGARVEVAPYKRDPMDFVLWKPSKADEPAWPSPWGNGRPGWHIECSAMSAAYFGEVFDIHAGGIDLVFPHHENEIAQSCCAFGNEKMANVWMHNGFLQVEGQKMSKSLGNFKTIREVLNDWPGEVLRLTMLKTHYRQPIDWTVKSLEESAKTLKSWAEIYQANTGGAPAPSSLAFLYDDLNTSGLMGDLHQLASAAQHSAAARATFSATLDLLGILPQAHEVKIDAGLEAKINTLVEARLAARAAKNWAESDRLRDELTKLGIAVKDNKDGTSSWAPLG